MEGNSKKSNYPYGNFVKNLFLLPRELPLNGMRTDGEYYEKRRKIALGKGIFTNMSGMRKYSMEYTPKRARKKADADENITINIVAAGLSALGLFAAVAYEYVSGEFSWKITAAQAPLLWFAVRSVLVANLYACGLNRVEDLKD